MMFGVGVEYALHCLLYLIDPPADAKLVMKDIALFQGVSETYLSKIFARMKKGGLVRSTPGVKGGYELARSPEKITFLEVVEAVEGPISLFQCRNIRAHCILDQGREPLPELTAGVCTIHGVMLEAEAQLRRHLQAKTLDWLHQKVQALVPAERQEATRQWFAEAIGE